MTHLYLTDEIYQKLVSLRRVKVAMALKYLFLAGKEGEVLSLREVQSLTTFTAKSTYRLANEDIFSHYLTPIKILREGQLPGKNRRGRPEKVFRVPTLEEIEKFLGCTEKRRHSIEFSDEKELKAKVAAIALYHTKAKAGREFGLNMGIKHANMSNAYMIEKSGMSKNTWKKYIKKSVRTQHRQVETTLTVSVTTDMQNTYGDYKRSNKKGWSHLEVDGAKFPYSKTGAIEALKYAGSFERVSVITQLSSHRILVADLPEPELNAIDCYLVYGGAITLEDYQRLHPGFFGKPEQEEHKEHYNLALNFQLADEHRQKMDEKEEQRILKQFAYKKL